MNKKYVVLNKAVGETPLSCLEAWRAAEPPATQSLPLAYAGRLDPMASGKLLVLIGEECKRQEKYHALDKQYVFSVLCGVATDTQDVLGRIEKVKTGEIDAAALRAAASELTGPISLPYPHFSSKTVKGKPLHVWTLEGKLNEITIPTNATNIYSLKLLKTHTLLGSEIATTIRAKIDTIPPVTDLRKTLGNDFRRTDVRADWESFKKTHTHTPFTIATFRAIASSGTYMRSLANVLALKVGTVGLAYSIDREEIGHYQKIPLLGGFWRKRFK